MTLADLNSASREEFVQALGFAFEHSPWIAQAAWERRPFANIESLQGAMLDALAQASDEARVALIAVHPDLAGRVAREGRLTAASQGEQTGAGLDRLSPQEVLRFDRLNDAYRSRFGFPFVICAREHNATSILDAMQARTQNDRATEIATALVEIGKIARLRLGDTVTA
jgi:OHCU decarboxylase